MLRKEHAFLYSTRNFKPFSAILRGRYILRPRRMGAVTGGSRSLQQWQPNSYSLHGSSARPLRLDPPTADYNATRVERSKRTLQTVRRNLTGKRDGGRALAPPPGKGWQKGAPKLGTPLLDLGPPEKHFELDLRWGLAVTQR